MFGIEAWLELGENMMLAISSLSVGCFYLKESLKNDYVNILCFFVVSAIDTK